MCLSLTACLIILSVSSAVSGQRAPMANVAFAEHHHAIHSKVWTKEEFPNPQTAPQKCGREEPSFVCDPVRVLPQVEADALDYMIRKSCNDTRCTCAKSCGAACPGYSISVAVVPKMADAEKSNKLFEVERWAVYLRTVSWRFGHCDDDIVIVFTLLDQQVFTSTGRAVRHRLTNECVINIFRDVTHMFANGNYGPALKTMVTNYKQVLDGKSCSRDAPYNTAVIVGISLGSFSGLIFLFLMVIWCCGFCRVRISSFGDTRLLTSSGWPPGFGWSRQQQVHLLQSPMSPENELITYSSAMSAPTTAELIAL